MNRNSSVIHAGIWNSIGTFLLKGIVFLSVPIFSRLLSPEDYGLVSTYNTYISFITIIVGLSFNTALANARIDYADHFAGYCNSIVSASVILFVFQVAIFNCIYPVIGGWLLLSRLLLNLILCAGYVDFLVRTYYGVNMVDYRYRDNLKISLTNAVLSITVSVILINLLPDKVLARLIGQFLFLVLVLPYILSKMISGGSFWICMEHIRYSVRIAVPNIFHQIAQIIISQSDRVMILKLANAQSAGKYSLVYTYSLVMQMLWNAVNDVWVPWLFRRLSVDDAAKIRRCSYVYMAGFSVLTVFAMVIAPDLLILLAPESYFDAKPLIVPLILSTYYLFLYSFFVNIEFYYKKNSCIALATALASAINIAGNLILLPVYGYKAAAYTTLLSYFFLMLFHGVVVQFFLKIKIYQMRFFVICATLMSAFAGLCGLLLNHFWARYVVLGIILAGGAFICLKNKKKWREALEIFRKQ